MATLDEIEAAIRVADKAGRADDVKRLAKARQEMIAGDAGGWLSDVGKSLATGIRQGAESVVGLPGDIERGSDWLAEKTGLQGTRFLGAPVFPGGNYAFPSSSDINEQTSKVVGENYEPQTETGKYFRTGGEFAGGAIAPGGWLSRAARVVAPAVATETAGQLAESYAPEYEPAVRAVVGLLSGGGTEIAASRHELSKALKVVGTNPAAAKRVNEILVSQGMTPDEAAAAMRKLGGESTFADVNPAARQEAQQIQARSIEGRGVIDPKMRSRYEATGDRLKADTTTAVGPQEELNPTIEALKQRKEALGPDYDAAHKAQTKPVDTQAILDGIDSDLAVVKSPETTKALEGVRKSLMLRGTDQLDPSTEGLHEARKAIDNVLFDQNGNPRDIGGDTARRLKGYRKQIDDALDQSGPIKAVDEKYRQVAKEEKAVQTGRDIYNTGKDSPSPKAFQDTVDAMSPGEKDHLLKGVNMETWRRIGVTDRERQQLQTTLRGESKWNYEKLKSVIGEQKAQALIGALERESVFTETYNKVIQGSKTAESLTPSPGEGLKGATVDVLAATAAGGPQAGLAVGASKAARASLAKLLAAKDADPEIARLLMSSDPDDVRQAAEIVRGNKRYAKMLGLYGGVVGAGGGDQ